MTQVSLDLVKARLADSLDSWLPRLFPAARAIGPHWKLGDIGGAPGGSLAVWRSGPKRGEWWDFNDGVGGSPLDLFLAGKGFSWGRAISKEGVDEAVRYLGLDGLEPKELEQRQRQALADANARSRIEAERAEKLKRNAKGHFLSAHAILGTPAERYLLQRGIDLKLLFREPRSLRFKAMLDPEHHIERPCLIAPVIDCTSGEFLSIHRTFLHCLADGRVKKATADPERPMEDAKRAYCAYRGGLIPLWKGRSQKRFTQPDEGEILTVSEGKEDGLSVALVMPERRVAAALSLDNLGFLKLPEAYAKRLTFAGQNDTNAKAIASLERAGNRLADRGIELVIAKPPAGIKDWNDWLIAIQSGDADGPKKEGAAA